MKPLQTYIHWFNPQNDLALANGSPNFTAPTSALQLASSGACLPMWYAAPGDYFIGAVNASWFREICDTFDIHVLPTSHAIEEAYPMPWGWSAQAVRFLEQFGFSPECLPDVTDIEELRRQSSRVFGTKVISRLLNEVTALTDGHNAFCMPAVAVVPEQVYEYILTHGVTMIKLPWSSSGRGQQVSDRTTPKELENRINGMLNRQGAVELSPYYNKLLDFAMLWDDGRFVGYSLFDTDTHGGWLRNILLPDNKIEQIILSSLGRHVDLSHIRHVLQTILQEEYKGYNGPIGVDFIIVEVSQGTNMMIPIETNLRRTMGHVAHNLANRFMGFENSGMFRISPKDLVNEPYHTVKDCDIHRGRLTHGSIDIVPPGGTFRFIFSVNDK